MVAGAGRVVVAVGGGRAGMGGRGGRGGESEGGKAARVA